MTAETCQRFREELAALRHGEEPAIGAEELRSHLAACADCRRAQEQAAAVADLLRSCQPPLPPGGFDRLSAAVAELAARSSGPARSAAPGMTLSVRIALAAAAALVVAAALLFAASRDRKSGAEPRAAEAAAVIVESRGAAPGRDGAGSAVEVGRELGTGRGGALCLVTARGARLELGENSRILVLSADAVRLESGRLLAGVEKGSSPFRVLTADAEVRTLGTRFSVTKGADEGTQVTVIEGRVLFRGLAGGAIEVAAGQSARMAAGGAPGRPAAASPGDLGELLPAPAPRLEMTLELARAEVAPGGGLAGRLELVNRSGGELNLESLGGAMPLFFLRIVDPAGRGSFACPMISGATVDGRAADQGELRLPTDAVCRLELDLGAPLETPGEYCLTMICFGRLRSDAAAGWSGSLESRAVMVKVKAPEARGAGGPGESRGGPRP